MTTPVLTESVGLVERAVGGPAVLAVTVAGVDVSAALLSGTTIRHGRSNTTSPPEAPTCTVQLRSAALAQLPEPGDVVTVELGADARAWLGITDPADVAVRRFTGRVSDVSVTPGRPGVEGIAQLVAVGYRRALADLLIGDEPWPEELDGARAARILQLAYKQVEDFGFFAGTGTPTWAPTPGDSDPGAFTVNPLDVDNQPAAKLLDQLALEAGGVLVEQRDGRLAWHDYLHRDNPAPTVELDAGQLLANLTAVKDTRELANAVYWYWGPLWFTGVDGTPYWHSEGRIDYPSVGRHGVLKLEVPGPSVPPILRDKDAAVELSRQQLAVRRKPRWKLGTLVVDVTRTVGLADALPMLRTSFGDLVSVSGLPADGPFSAARLFVEGWTETVSRNAWRLDLTVSEYGATAPPARYSDVVEATTYADVDPALEYLDVFDPETI